MNISLGRIVILVKDYDDALTFYKENLGCKVIVDFITDNDQRFLQVGFGDDKSTGIWFLKADNDEQLEKVGHQSAGQPMMVLYTDSIKKIHKHLVDNQVNIIKQPVDTPEFTFFHFLDLYGNEIVIVELRK